MCPKFDCTAGWPEVLSEGSKFVHCVGCTMQNHSEPPKEAYTWNYVICKIQTAEIRGVARTDPVGGLAWKPTCWEPWYFKFCSLSQILNLTVV